MINPAQLRREALERQERERTPSQQTFRCPDCYDTIDRRRTEEDAHAMGVQRPAPGWHDCHASPERRPSFAQTSYNWRDHGR